MKRGGRRVGLKKITAPKPSTPKSTPKRLGTSSTESTPKRTTFNTPKSKRRITASPSVHTPGSDSGQRAGIESKTACQKWTREREQLLCTMWEEEIHLYDATSKDYRNTNKRQQALQRFSAVLGLDGKCTIYAWRTCILN